MEILSAVVVHYEFVVRLGVRKLAQAQIGLEPTRRVCWKLNFSACKHVEAESVIGKESANKV